MKELKTIVRDNLPLIVDAVNNYNKLNPNNPILKENIVSLEQEGGQWILICFI